MNLEDNISLTLGDWLPDGTSRVVYEDDNKTVVWTRTGNAVKEDTYHRNFTSLLEANAEEAKQFNSSGQLGTNVKLASVPLSVHMAWAAEGILDDDKALARRLNDPDLAKFRVNNLRA